MQRRTIPTPRPRERNRADVLESNYAGSGMRGYAYGIRNAWGGPSIQRRRTVVFSHNETRRRGGTISSPTTPPTVPFPLDSSTTRQESRCGIQFETPRRRIQRCGSGEILEFQAEKKLQPETAILVPEAFPHEAPPQDVNGGYDIKKTRG